MRRRKLVIALASTLGVLAAALVAGTAFLELSTRDYKLAWMFRRTKRIEWSSVWNGSRIVEIDDPSAVGTIVSIVTSKLDRIPPRRQDRLPMELRFVLDDDREIVLLRFFATKNDAWSLIRVPGGPFHPYEISSEPLWDVLRGELGIKLGRIKVEGQEANVEIEYATTRMTFGISENANGHTWHLTTEWLTGLPGPLCASNRAPCRLVRHDGSSEEQGMDLMPARQRTELHLPVDIVDLEAVELTANYETTRLKLPPIRFRELVVPACPTCGAGERVIPWIYDWAGPPPLKGRCKVSDASGDDRPQFFCERCQASF